MKISVIVKPGVREDKVEKIDASTYCVSVKARPVDGKANEAVVALLAKQFSVPRRNVSVLTGARSKIKRVEVIAK